MSFFKSISSFIKYLFIILFHMILLVAGLVLVVFGFKGKIYIEIIIFLILIYMLLFWRIWFHYSKKKLIKNYDPEKDKARKCEDDIYDDKKTKTKGGEECKSIGGRESIRRTRRTKQDIDTASEDVVRPKQSKGRELLQTTKASDNGKTSSSNRKNGRGIRKLLRRRGRKS